MYCHRHPDRPAVAACVRCGNLLCGGCDVTVGGRHYCRTCLGGVGGPGSFHARRFLRTRHDRMLAGVCGGLARYFGLDPALVRVAVVLGALFTAVFPFVLIYLVVTLLTPAED